jgi:hypothetical protein
MIYDVAALFKWGWNVGKGYVYGMILMLTEMDHWGYAFRKLFRSISSSISLGFRCGIKFYYHRK